MSCARANALASSFCSNLCEKSLNLGTLLTAGLYSEQTWRPGTRRLTRSVTVYQTCTLISGVSFQNRSGKF